MRKCLLAALFWLLPMAGCAHLPLNPLDWLFPDPDPFAEAKAEEARSANAAAGHPMFGTDFY